MDEAGFIERSTQDPLLLGLLQEVAGEVRERVVLDAPQHYTIGGVDVLVFLAAATLYRWAKETLDHRRQAQQIQVVQQQVALIAALVEKGLPQKEAQTLVMALLQKIEQRPPDDPALSQALKLLK